MNRKKRKRKHISQRNKKHSKSSSNWLKEENKNLQNLHPGVKEEPNEDQTREKTRESLKCDICGFSSILQARMLNHRSKKHGILVPCQECPKLFENTTQLHCHLLKKDGHSRTNAVGGGGARYFCPECDITFKRGSELSKHFNRVHKAGCVSCCRPFPSRRELSLHFNSECEYALHCNFCHYATAIRQTFRGHVIYHLPDADCFACSICTKKFHTAKLLSHHVAKHSRPKVKVARAADKQTCERCGKDYRWLRTHQRTCHHELFQQEKFKCSVCIYSTDSLWRFERHVKGAVCQVCGEQFNCSKAFERHGHNKRIESCICSECGKTFETRHRLQQHAKRHKPDYNENCACNVCGRTYRAKGALKFHRMREHPELFDKEILSCPRCSFVTKYPQTLESHIEKHTLNAQICIICNKTFISARDLRNHLNIHSGVKPYECDLCDAKFSSPNYLRIHGRVHGIIPPKRERPVGVRKSLNVTDNLRGEPSHLHQPQASTTFIDAFYKK